MKYLNEEFQKQGGPNLFDDPVMEQDLRDKAEMAKRTLSSREKTSVFLSAGGVTASITLTRETFETITRHLLRQTQSIMEFVLEDAGMQWKDIDKILLVGGSTRMKAVPAMIERVTGIKPSMDVNPDEVVAMGAAIQGTLIQVQQGTAQLHEAADFPIVEVQDVNSHSLGVVALDENDREINSIVLKKDTPIPCKVSGRYVTSVDNQTQLHVQVTEGEDTDLNYVKIVGEGVMDLPPRPKGSPLEVIFEYDRDGIIHVSVVDLTSGQRLGELKIERVSNLTEEEVAEKQQRLGKLAIG